MFSLILSTLLAAAPQSPWVVDRDGRPGTNFTDLPPAVAAAAHGDTILVRAATSLGIYGQFTVNGKALTIRGEGAVRPQCLGASIGAVPPGSVFALHGLAMSAGVVIDNSNVAIASCSLSIDIANGSHVVVSRSSCGPTQIRSGSTMVANGSSFSAPNYGYVVYGCSSYSSSSALVANNARLLLHDCRAVGGVDAYFFPGGAFGGCIGPSYSPHPALVLTASSVRIAGARTVMYGGLTASYFAPTIAADATTQGVVHGNVSIVSPPQFAQVPDVLPVRSVGGTMLPGEEIATTSPVTVTLSGHLPGAPLLMAFDTTPPSAVDLGPIALGEVMLPASSYVLAATLDSAGMFAVTLPGSLVPWVDTPVFGQAAVLDATAGSFLMSNLETRLFAN
ncbi:MAG: hypothetical protein AB7O97_20345 [Planctomycetota bacterium]